MAKCDPDPPFEQLEFFSQRHQPKRMPIAHWHSQIELNYLSHGRMTYLINGQLVPLPAERLGVFWGAVPHQVVVQEGESDLVVIYMPLGAFLALKLPDDFRQRLMGGGVLVDRKSDPADRILLPRWHEDLSTGRDDLRDLAWQEVANRLRRLALTGYELRKTADVAARPDSAGHDRGTIVGNLAQVQKMAVLIAEGFKEQLSVKDVARAADLHPNYAMTLFRRAIGMTVTDYLTRQRLSHAQSMLIDTDLPVAIIATESGFGSQSRFYEVFRQWLGKSPTRFRSDLAKAAGSMATVRPRHGQAAVEES